MTTVTRLPDFAGQTVDHHLILDYEDAGMMGGMVVVEQALPSS